MRQLHIKVTDLQRYYFIQATLSS